ncbi:MAG: hypothetical protein IJ009_07590 [Clostridia bacterium]|nr:hypothetical protein [Clostridia bacterium]
MKEIAKKAEKIGADCEYIYCSSDPDSLDGLILEKNGHRIGILDGTAPHTRCTEVPGAVDEIINLGEFWDSSKLTPHREQIFSLQQKKAEAYRRAYRFLRIAGEADTFLSDLLEPCVKKEKMAKAISRTVRQIPESEARGTQIRYRQACSIRGLVYLPTESKKTVVVSDYLGSARFYLLYLSKELEAQGRHRCTVFPSCYTDTVIDAILLPSNGILFTSKEEGEEPSVNMKRFLDNERLSLCRSQIRHLRNVCRDMQEHALASLREAGDYHFALEELYGKAMNFDAKGEYIAMLSEKILSYLQGGG